jgi:hypothetical protein
MKRTAEFTATDKLKALAIARIFETSTPFGDYTAVAVLGDGAGVSYGSSQFTHRSGALAEVVARYLAKGGVVGRTVLESRMVKLRGTEKRSVDALAKDDVFEKALKAAGVTREMRAAQDEIAFEKFLKPSLAVCVRMGFAAPLSLAVIYDSLTHGSWAMIRDRVRIERANERAWITEYVIQRHRWLGSIPRLEKTRYRTRFFLEQIARGNWDLALPLTVNGHRLDAAAFGEAAADVESSAAKDPAAGPRPQVTDRGDSFLTSSTSPVKGVPHGQDGEQPTPNTTGDPVATAPGSDTSQPPGGWPPDILDEAAWRKALRVYDRVERLAETALIRSDRAKSLWTMVAGSLWQAVWAVVGFLTHMPRVFWLIAAMTAAVLTGLYLYRQIVLGKMREGRMAP